MLKLILNENMKLYSRVGQFIMIFILMGLSVFTSIYTYKTTPQSVGDWKVQTEQKIQTATELLNNPQIPNFQKSEVEKQLKLDKYALSHDISPNTTVYEQVAKQASLLSIITMMTAVVAGGIVSNEYVWGTIKLLLIRPISRSKILLSKYFASLMFAFLLVIVLLATSFVTNGILYGFDNSDNPYLFIGPTGEVSQMSMVVHTLQTYSLKSVEIVIYLTLAFMLSVVFRSNALAIGATLLLLLLGPQLTSMFAQQTWSKYILFANTDLTMVTMGSNPFGLTLPFSLTVLGSYLLLFITISWITFQKRDIA
ncbi:ABC transporter permease [Desulfosporosinus sp.]|uniref:ABC transporter permease n=1 Tax=Desulfosporosinus sp. TaxID=157907 RepID=UPI0025BEC85A|nr:ABC transporter permease [Desulfosporosinus sp.]MBC2725507.1 ABC transporter permease [Desulfosporosinus sp.]